MTAQRDEQWLKTATPEQVAAAEEAGELNELLGRRVPFTRRGQVSVRDLQKMTPEEISAAYEAGDLDEALGRR